jgi:sulfite reductase alpha subunit-like flavoprotein
MERRMLVLYGTQTGTAYDVSERIAREAQRRHIRAVVMAMDEYPTAELVAEPLVNLDLLSLS